MRHPGDVPQRRCEECGRALEEHNRHLRFRLPQPVLEIPEDERAGRTWGNEDLMQVEGIGAFVRVLVPVHLTGGYTLTFGAWLGVHPDDLRRAFETWWQPEYQGLRLEGRLANLLPPWEEETYTKPVAATVEDPDAVPYATESSDDMMQRVLTSEWPHEVILAAVAPYES